MTDNTPAQTNANKNYLTVKEEKAFWSTIKSRKGNQAERDFALLKLGRICGLRRQELVNLNVGDVMGKSKLIVDERIAVKGATGEVYISKDGQGIVARFLHKKRKWQESLDLDAPLFISKKGSRISIRAVNNIMTKWCTEAEIPPYTPHALRHTKARRIMDDFILLSPDERDKRLQFVNQQLRHKSWGATLIYTKPTKEQMERVGEI